MEVQFLYHSGFALLAEQATVLFDLFDPEGKGPSLAPLLSRPGALYVLSSHSHHDHYSVPLMQEILSNRPDAKFILAKEIAKGKRFLPPNAAFLRAGERFSDGALFVEAHGSTDVGVSFYLELEGKKLFHAGDLNAWHWREESTAQEIAKAHGDFLAVLKPLAQAHPALDAAFFPVDPRMGKEFWQGAAEFLSAIRCRQFFPMHFWEDFSAVETFQKAMGEAGRCIVPLTRYGQIVPLE